MANTPLSSKSLSQDTLIAAWKKMQYLRRFEEKAANLYQQQHINGFCHLYIGQEAVAVGCKWAQPDADFITSYRCHAHALVCGLSGEEVMGELTGRTIGISKGKGGSMHMFEPSKRFWGGHGIVAAQVPLGAGLAFAAKYLGEEQRPSFTFIGDGAMNAGQVFESFNMAALWKLPAIFIIENNQYGMGTSVKRAFGGALAGKELHETAEPFGIAHEKVDGMDFFAVYDAIQKAAAHCAAGNGPYVLEMDTYRYRGHSMSDPAKYRTRDDVDNVRESRDPIVRLQKHLVETFGMKDEQFEAWDEEMKTEVNAIAETALAAPRPAPSEIWTDVYAS